MKTRAASLRRLVISVVAVSTGFGAAAEDSLDHLLRTVLDQASQRDVPFREVVRIVTGCRVLPLRPAADPDRAIVEGIASAVAQSLERLNQPDSPARAETRINEVSVHFERALREIIDAHPDFSCERPLTAAGQAQAAGYPDLVVRHLPSGRYAYLDPKLFQAGSAGSSLRTFYYTPRVETNKVRQDAYHLLVGIEHRGTPGAWTFCGWKLVDLHDFRVRLKAEYQAGNRDLYREELVVRSSRPAPAP